MGDTTMPRCLVELETNIREILRFTITESLLGSCVIFASATHFHVYLPWVNPLLAQCQCESASRSFQPGENPNCETLNFAEVRLQLQCLAALILKWAGSLLLYEIIVVKREKLMHHSSSSPQNRPPSPSPHLVTIYLVSAYPQRCVETISVYFQVQIH